MDTIWQARTILVFLCIASLTIVGVGSPGPNAHAEEKGPYAAWENGPAKGSGYFPIGVWLQAPRNAARYKALGINVYVALWAGPTEQQIVELKRQGMPVICEQNAFALSHLNERTIVGWMHGDEPDNAQSLGENRGYGPPVPPEKIVEDYRRIRAKDPTRPVMLNLGQGVAWDGWFGRGVRTNHPEDYPKYLQGCDIASFDIYPAVHDHPAVVGKLWYVARGVDRLRRWTEGQKPVWSCIECTHIGNAKVKPTPAQVKAEVWMAIIHGAQGILYFVHQFEPKFVEAALLDDAEMMKAVTEVNRQVQGLAEVIHRPSIQGGVSVQCDPPEVSKDLAQALSKSPVAVAGKKHAGAFYVFAVRMESKPVKATLQVAGLTGASKVEVVGEGRTIEAADGRFADRFDGHAVHIYRIAVSD